MDITPYSPQLEALFQKNGVTLAYLFGSQAEGKAGPMSDIDIAVLLGPTVPRERYGRLMVSMNAALVGILHFNDIDLVILNQATPLLAFEVVRYGKAIYLPDRQVMEDLAVRTLHRYVDTKPLRQLTVEYLGERVRQRQELKAAAEHAPQPVLHDVSTVLWPVSGRRRGMKHESLVQHLRKLQEYVDRLRPFQSRTLDEIAGDYVIYWAVLHGLQVAIQNVIDVGSHILAGTGVETPGDYRTVITELGRQGILPADLAERLEEAVGFRNALVHEYLTIDKEIVYHSLVDGLADLEGFIDHVYVYLQRNGYVGSQVD